jgi:hypothetical protein
MVYGGISMERKNLPIGIDNFKKLITRDYYFIDKTMFIKELIDNKASVNLFTRPRRFGKTLNMSMLQYFFEDARERDGQKHDNSYLFEGLNIMSQGENYLSHMGQYPVINLSLKSGKQPDFEMAHASLIDEIQKEYFRHNFILLGDALDDDHKDKFEKIRTGKAEKIAYAKSLEFLSECLELYYGKKVIILIDEYDVPLENSFFEGFYKEMVSFIRSLFESALKTNSNLEFAVITGCLNISKESIFTDLNILYINTVLSDEYDEYFGFTGEDVMLLCKDYNIEHKYETIKEWYNGNIFGKTNVYNPWSLIRYVRDILADDDNFPSDYWANTSSNSIVKSLIERADEDTKQEIEALIEGNTIEKPIHEDITYGEIYDTMDNLWNFMFITGYFKKIGERMDERTHQQYAELTIPNHEVKYIFRTKILSWFQEKIKEKDLTRLYTALINKDVPVFEEELSEMLLETISFNDAYESFYHGFVAGVLSGMKGYITKSNREGGNGRSDLYIKPVTRRKPAYVIEFKIANKFSELDKRADDALQQIEDKKYVQELNDDGYATVVKYGIAFFGKDCLIKMKE